MLLVTFVMLFIWPILFSSASHSTAAQPHEHRQTSQKGSAASDYYHDNDSFPRQQQQDQIYATLPVRRSKPLMAKQNPLYRRQPGQSEQRHRIQHSNVSRISVANMTCEFMEQPLNHFALPRDSSPTYLQRYCYYSNFVASGMFNATVPPPIFLYTGNESPLEEYINHTGLIWELAESMHAFVVFVEHRYEGKSLPTPNLTNCLAYSSSVQALADLATFMETKLDSLWRSSPLVYAPEDTLTEPTCESPSHRIRPPVIAFGGSYGGMLSAWLRFLYPHLVSGAIAASAPIWGLPRSCEQGLSMSCCQNNKTKIDSAWQVVSRGLKLPYPPTDKEEVHSDPTAASANHCAKNLLAAWPLIQILGTSMPGRGLLSSAFRLCPNQMLSSHDAQRLIQWAQSPWFDLAEGSFPYPSSYITFALTKDDSAMLPAWPLQAACWKNSSLHSDFGVRIEGNVNDGNVHYSIVYGGSDIKVSVDWDNVTLLDTTGSDENKNRPSLIDDLIDPRQSNIVDLLASVRDAVSVWFNVTLDVTCYDLAVAPNQEAPAAMLNSPSSTKSSSTAAKRSASAASSDIAALNIRQRQLLGYHDDRSNHEQACSERLQEGSWPALCCNEDMILIITEARGLGHDVFWPPSHPRGTRRHADVVTHDAASWTNVSRECRDPEKIFGFPQSAPDPWSAWLDVIYGGTKIQDHSNVVFSNGLLDPWAAAGVYAHDPTVDFGIGNVSLSTPETMEIVPGLYMQNISRGMIALILEYGGHHTDLMYSSEADPPSITKARRVERDYIEQWIVEWRRNA